MVFSSSRDRVVGLSSKKGQKKKKKLGSIEPGIQKESKMKVAIIRSTSWTATVFKLRLFFNPRRYWVVIGRQMETGHVP